MTVTEVPAINSYAGNGSSTQFDFDFYISSESELKVVHTSDADVITELTNGIDYTVNEVANPNGSYITFPLEGSNYTVLQSDELITLYLDIPFEQGSEFDNQSSLNLSALEEAFDYAMRLMQLLKRETDRSVKFDIGNNFSVDDMNDLLADIAAAGGIATIAQNAATQALAVANLEYNVTANPYSAINDLSVDASAAIQQAIDDAYAYAQSVSTSNRSVVVVRVPEGDFKCASQITVKPKVMLHVDGLLHNYMTDGYDPLVVFQAGSHCRRLQIWCNNKSGVVFGQSSQYANMQIGDVRLLNVGESYDAGSGSQTACKFIGYNFTVESLDMDGGNIGLDLNTCSDVRIDKVLTYTASTAVRITSACEHIFIGYLDIDSPNHLGIQIDTCADIELPSVTIFLNDNEVSEDLTSGYAIKIGEYSAADVVENLKMNVRVVNTGGTALYLSNITDSIINIQANNGNIYTGNTYPLVNGIEYGSGIADSVNVIAQLEVTTNETSGSVAGNLFNISDGLKLTLGGNLIVTNLPTSDPTVAGAIYSDAGTLKISAG